MPTPSPMPPPDAAIFRAIIFSFRDTLPPLICHAALPPLTPRIAADYFVDAADADFRQLRLIARHAELPMPRCRCRAATPPLPRRR
jgi:hypothetical protein